MDGWMARIDELARWWTSASQEARFALLQKSFKEGTPTFVELRAAILLAETEAGEIGEG